MRASVLKSTKNIVVEEYPLRALNNGELLVKVACCGVCGTDKHIFEGKSLSSIPIILGHEYSGVIADKSPNIKRFSIGDKVVIDPNINCGSCKYCKKGFVNHCENLRALGVTLNGGFAEFSIIPDSQAYLLKNDFNLDDAAFAEPLSCCLRGIEHANIKPGNSVVIIGGGSIGLLMVQLVNLCGAAKVIVIEAVESKRKLASQLGADLALDSTEKDLQAIIVDYTNGGADVVIECVGKRSTIEQSFDLVDKGGTVVIFGLVPVNEVAEINLHKIFRKEIKIFNSFLNPFTFNSAVDLLISGKIDVSRLITSQTTLNNINEIFLSNNYSSKIKIQVKNQNKEE